MSARDRQGPYVPKHYGMDEPQARAHIKCYPFATIMTDHDGMKATHTPLYFANNNDDCTQLLGHIARVNPQTAALENGGEMLAIFNGPSGYVSPLWYLENEDVPTWVYQAVHVRGTIEPIGSGAPLESLMEHIIKCSEVRNGTNWQMDRIERSNIERMLPRIIGFRLTIQKITGISKMEQGQSEKNKRNLIEHFQSGIEDAGPQIAKVLRAQI